MPPNHPPPCRTRLIGALLLAALASPAVHAERADRDKPVEVEADSADRDEKAKVTIFRGNVVITQGTLVIRGDKVTVREETAGRQTATALGEPATFRQKRDGIDEYIEGRGQRMDYDSQTQILQLRDNAEVKRGEDWVRGQFIEYNGVNGTYRAVGESQQSEGATAGGGGRVKAVIQPRKATADTPSR
ncbi:MAG: lipopolysaccharide transport periplasmic protein LptA [Rhodocyclaceae bacterium]|nr:lipopolysaccharide transport periplasmic protein LptA [Rhodocyclaceae bacterium]